MDKNGFLPSLKAKTPKQSIFDIPEVFRARKMRQNTLKTAKVTLKRAKNGQKNGFSRLSEGKNTQKIHF